MGSTRVWPRSVRLYSTRRGASAWRSTRPYCWYWLGVLGEDLGEMPPMRATSSP